MAIRKRVRALRNDPRGVVQCETNLAREALRATFGLVRLMPNAGGVYAEFDNAVEELLVAVGVASMAGCAGGI